MPTYGREMWVHGKARAMENAINLCLFQFSHLHHIVGSKSDDDEGNEPSKAGIAKKMFDNSGAGDVIVNEVKEFLKWKFKF